MVSRQNELVRVFSDTAVDSMYDCYYACADRPPPTRESGNALDATECGCGKSLALAWSLGGLAPSIETHWDSLRVSGGLRPFHVRWNDP